MILRKKKRIKYSKTRGAVTFSDTDLFEPKTPIHYSIQNGVCILQKAMTPQDAMMHISTKGAQKKPLIDMRNQHVRNAFSTFDELDVFIYDDRVVIQGVNTKKPSILGRLKARLHPLRNGMTFDKVAFKQSTPQAFDAHIPLAIASYCSGAGLMDEGFKQAGFDVTFAMEIDEAAAASYVNNHGSHMHVGDITEHVNTPLLLQERVPVMIAGTPCQGFSAANRNEKDKTARYQYIDHPKNKLVKSYIELIHRNPACQVFVLENVPEILTAGDGHFRDEIIAQLPDFEITYGLCTASDYGDAQKRERAFFIGSKIGRIDLPEALTASCPKTSEDALYGLHDGIPNQTDVSRAKRDTLDRIQAIPQGGNYKNIPYALQTKSMQRTKNTHASMYARLHPNKPSPTIINPRKSMMLHPYLDRILSVRECARLFGCPDSFTFVGNLADKQQQVANGVAVGVVRAIGFAIKKAIHHYQAMRYAPQGV